MGESRAALVQSMEELTEMVKEVNERKVLMVDCEVGGCMKDVPHLWKRLQLTRVAGADLFQLVVDGNEVLEKGVCTLITYTLIIDIWILYKHHLSHDFPTAIQITTIILSRRSSLQ